MSLLIHLGFFATIKIDPNYGDQEGYVLTPSSKLLIKSEMANLSPFVQAMVDPVLVNPWQFLGDWFRSNEETAFETAHGVAM
ncbi:putative O-methyltransferase 3 [Camellia lanceoleosa]|uniref:O-methyltransferase 3 n=1 Tax=Camellia lanceoleosa TaxID=1840588 RepID=A0ACC0GEX1_9ERIC|nr:putative O-methyltransferase 3 [Camellia lanceoleosa]